MDASMVSAISGSLGNAAISSADWPNRHHDSNYRAQTFSMQEKTRKGRVLG